MKVLGIETSTPMGGVALIDGTTLVAEYRLALPLRHSEKLLPLIDTLLKDTRMALSDLSAIAISIGPGSYTGLRIGLATAKGLAMATGLPLLPVSTLEALATPFQFLKMMIVPMMISRKEEVFWGLFAPSGSGQEQDPPQRDDCALVRLYPDSVSSWQEALAAINQEWECQLESQCGLRNGIIFVGEGALSHRDLILQYFQGSNSILFASYRDQLPLAYSVAELGRLQMNRGDVRPPSAVTPSYLSQFQPNVQKNLFPHASSQGEKCLA